MSTGLNLERVKKFIFQICGVVIITSLILFGGIYGITAKQTNNIRDTISLVVKEAIKEELNLFYSYMGDNIETYVNKQLEKIKNGEKPRYIDLQQIILRDRITLEKINRLTDDMRIKIDQLSEIYYSSF